VKNEAADLSRIGLNLIGNIFCVRAWEFEMRKSKELLENDFQTPGLCRIERVEEQPTYNDCASTVLTV
jgi:hypothetical protein